MEAKRPTKTKLRVERVGVKSVGQNNERKVEAIEIEEKDRDGAGDSKKRMRDEESSNSVNENEEVPEWEEISVEKWEASTGKKLKTIEIEFDVRVMEDIDFKAIRRFIANYTQKASFDASGLTELILAQDYLGSTIRQVDDTESFGFITVLNLHHHNSETCIRQISEFIESSAPKEQKAWWHQLLHRDGVALLINERLPNVPHTLVPTLHETIYEEIQWAIEDGNPFNFDTFIYITNFGHEDPQGLKPRQNKKRKTQAERKWDKQEDPVYLEGSTKHFTHPVTHSETRMIMAFPAKRVPSLLNNVKAKILEQFSW